MRPSSDTSEGSLSYLRSFFQEWKRKKKEKEGKGRGGKAKENGKEGRHGNGMKEKEIKTETGTDRRKCKPSSRLSADWK